jgi:hypothetical protein
MFCRKPAGQIIKSNKEVA